jgi:hypothetical protein
MDLVGFSYARLLIRDEATDLSSSFDFAQNLVQ